jgi:hypothetical protein
MKQSKQNVRYKQLKLKNKWKKSGIQISKQLRDVIHGYIMSDGYVGKNNVLYVHHSLNQKKFVLWLYSMLEPIRTSAPISKYRRIHSKTKASHVSLRFFTRSVLRGFRNMWYTQIVQTDGSKVYKKTLPKSFACFFNATFIAVWFAGDGTKTLGYRGAKFEVTAFSVGERLILKKLFLIQHGLKTNIIKSGMSQNKIQQWCLTISASQYDIFRTLISKTDLIPKLFPHKLHKK